MSHPVSIIIPWMNRGDRKPLFNFVWKWACARFDQVIVSEASDNTAPFCKSKLINQAIPDASEKVLGILDADSMVSDKLLADALGFAGTSGKLVYPYQHLLRLDVHQTALVLQQQPDSMGFDCRNFVWRTHNRRLPVTPGGFQLMHRDVFEAAGGYCETFTEWGCEDNYFRDSCRRTTGKEVRFGGYLYHLFHKPNEIRPPENMQRYYSEFKGRRSV